MLISGVCKQNADTGDDNTCGNISFQSTKSGAGLQSPPLDRVAEARVKGVFCSGTPVWFDAENQNKQNPAW